MKLDNRLILVLVAVVGIYAIFLFVSDYNIISEKISNFKINYLPLILFFVSASWIPLFIKWHFLLKNCEVDIPLTKSIAVFFSGVAFDHFSGGVYSEGKKVPNVGGVFSGGSIFGLLRYCNCLLHFTPIQTFKFRRNIVIV